MNIWRIARAVVTAPDVAHWITKYDAAKKENDRLEHELNLSTRTLSSANEELSKALRQLGEYSGGYETLERELTQARDKNAWLESKLLDEARNLDKALRDLEAAQERQEAQRQYCLRIREAAGITRGAENTLIGVERLKREFEEARRERDGAREENAILTKVLEQARSTLFISIKAPEDLQASLGKLNLACLEHYNWRTEKVRKSQPTPQAGEETPSKKLRQAGFERRPSPKSLPSDED